MEISPTDIERALEGINELALPVLAASCLYPMVCRLVRASVSTSPVKHRLPAGRCSGGVRKAVTALGLVVGIASPAAAAERRIPRGRVTRSVETANLRSEPGRYPPPRLPGPADPPSLPVGGSSTAPNRPGVAPPWAGLGGAASRRNVRTVHPAVHAEAAVSETLLFPRAGTERLSTGGTQDRDPAPAPARPRPRPAWHAVLPGETLWSIAADRLHTDDVRRIARYWPRIHKANRDEIGSNPNLIHPGQVLELPPESA